VAVVTATLVLVTLIAAVIANANRTVDLSLGDTAEVDGGSLTVEGWESPPEGGTDVELTVCPSDSGHLVDLSAFALVTQDGEVEPSGSNLSPGDGAGASLTSCLYGSVRFATAETPEQVVYASSPRLVWLPSAS
jgi:hypothetical protein